ncbi:hypothetical protein DY000_02008216 [Brassica cretica]|uniref:Malectin-like domain-containing protein n=1 Tax=Brassica cretica TaxID=69181 RepID=A0ABQ7BYY4_BRACR|nr:hypothetical protein DY000_02008216 [Brassica cretica]
MLSDLYGRFWLPSEINILLTGVPSSAASVDTSDASNKPPESILRNSWNGESLTLFDATLPTGGVPVYLAMYFSEPLEMSVRSFNIFFGSKKVGTGPIVPVYGKATQVVVGDVMASSSSQLVFQSRWRWWGGGGGGSGSGGPAGSGGTGKGGGSNEGSSGTGPSPLFGQQTGIEANQSTNEADMGDIDDLIGVNQSYVTQQH